MHANFVLRTVGLCGCVCAHRWQKEGERIVRLFLSVFNLKKIYEKTDDSLHNQFWSFLVFLQGQQSWCMFFFCCFFFFFKFYIIVLVLPNIKMNPPQVYMYSPSWTLLPPPSAPHPPGSSQCTSPSIQYCTSILDWQIFSYMIFYMFQCHSPKSSHPLTLPQSP